MTVIISGSAGIQNVLGSAASPAESNTTNSNTGVYFPTSTSVGISTNGTLAMTVDASQNVGLGTSSLSGARLDIVGNINNSLTTFGTADVASQVINNINGTALGQTSKILFRNGGFSVAGIAGVYTNFNGSGDIGGALSFGTQTNATGGVAERMRIDSSGNLLVGCTTLPASARTKGFAAKSNSTGGIQIYQTSSSTDWAINATSGSIANFYSDNGTALVLAGQIVVNGATTAYTSISDYRLKENVQPMVGALAKVQSLKPVTYTFKNGGQESQGFIAHELQEFVPECVMGAKDAVDADGKPVYQGVDTSFLVATLTAAIQEQQALITQLTDRIAALEAK